eukprot:TRINITY_DN1613_c0_g1_i1.p1 TRINITY_DN1613_c0_g1~~TRINITY_DN1613_c0_g1_i1.p1  ORF type:complete len:186 (-),score=35.27 TRINITY_DN1613_c0_g1_i1:15-572(-)
MSHRDHIKKVIFDEEALRTRVKELAAQINSDYKDSKELVVIGILKGAFMFLADLVRELTVPNNVEFMAISSYGAATQSSGQVRIILDLRTAIEGKDVLVVEDIVDTGLTMDSLLNMLKSRNPRSVQVAVLLKKSEAMKVELPIKYVGFDCPLIFVVGYGLDYAEKYRELPFIGELKEEVYKHPAH